VAAGALFQVVVAGVVGVRGPKCVGHRIGAFRDGDEVNVVGHEAIGEDAEVGVRVKLAEEVEVEGVVAVVEEDLLAAVAALGDVVGDVW